MLKSGHLRAQIWICIAAFLGGFAWLIYSKVSGFGMLHGDDFLHVGNNAYLRDFSADNVLWMLSNADIDYWRPLSFISHALDYKLWGEDIGGHHITSVFLHWCNAVLVAIVGVTTYQLARNEPPTLLRASFAAIACGVIAATIFVVHPQHVQTTAWIAERKGVLSALFSLLSVWAYLRSQALPHRAPYWSGLALMAFVFALLSKPMAITVPFVLLALDVFPLRRLTWSAGWRVLLSAIWDKLPYFVLTGAVTLYTYAAVRAGGFLNDADMFPLAERIINAARSVWLYPLRWLAPIGLSPIYPVAVLDNSVSFTNLLPLFGLLVVGCAGITLFVRGSGALLAALAIHLVIIAPVLGLISSGPQSSADRYAYLPDVVLCVALAIGLVRLWAQRAALKLVPACAAIAVVIWTFGLIALAQTQVLVFASDKSTHELVKRYYPQWQPYTSYLDGVAAFERGDIERAHTLLLAAVQYNEARHRAHIYLAFVFQRLGDNGLAYEHIKGSTCANSKRSFCNADGSAGTGARRQTASSAGAG